MIDEAMDKIYKCVLPTMLLSAIFGAFACYLTVTIEPVDSTVLTWIRCFFSFIITFFGSLFPTLVVVLIFQTIWNFVWAVYNLATNKQ